MKSITLFDDVNTVNDNGNPLIVIVGFSQRK